MRISMNKYTDDLLSLYSVTAKAKTPASVDLFLIEQDSPILPQDLKD